MGYADVGCFGGEGHQDAEPRPAGDGGHAVHELLRLAGGLHRVAAALHDRVLLQPRRPLRRAQPPQHHGITGRSAPAGDVQGSAATRPPCYGKWHLGIGRSSSPLRHGFDEFFGIPYSNDNGKYHPTLHGHAAAAARSTARRSIETDPDQSQFTRRFTERAVQFIERNKDKPFFLYLPHVMPHVPIFASREVQGASPRAGSTATWSKNSTGPSARCSRR